VTAMPPRPCQSDWQQRGADAEQDDGRQAGCPYPERRPSENDQPQDRERHQQGASTDREQHLPKLRVDPRPEKEPKSGAYDEECNKRELQCLSDRL
jgi:hypothetical protein